MQTVSPDLSRRPAWRSVAAYLRSHLAEFWDHYIALLIVIAAIDTAGLIKARPPKISVTYQPTVGDGLAGRHPFEALLTLDRSTDPSVPGYAIPAGATIRFSFPEAFAAQAGAAPSAVLLHAWSQGPIPASFTIVRNDAKPGEIAIRLHEAIAPRPPEAPGLKAIHLWTDEVNPSAGDYPITVEFANAGPLFGTTTAIAHITPAPVSSIGAYNRLHDGRNEDWQHVMPGAEARIPIDFVATLPDGPGAAISLRRAEGGSVIILANGEPVGWIRTEGAPVNLTPEMLGPDLARLGSHASARPRAQPPGLHESSAKWQAAPSTRSSWSSIRSEPGSVSENRNVDAPIAVRSCLCSLQPGAGAALWARGCDEHHGSSRSIHVAQELPKATQADRCGQPFCRRGETPTRN